MPVVKFSTVITERKREWDDILLMGLILPPKLFMNITVVFSVATPSVLMKMIGYLMVIKKQEVFEEWEERKAYLECLGLTVEVKWSCK